MTGIYKKIGIALMVLAAMACQDDIEKEDQFLDDATGNFGNVEQNNPYWMWVGSFPGWISMNAERCEATQVTVDGVYEKPDPDNRIGLKDTPWFSTGFYAAPGEKVKVVKPAGMGKVNWRIGEWKCIIPDGTVLKRYSKIYETGTLDKDTTEIMNYFGGHIYIVPEVPFTKPETFTIIGAVKSPDFILGETDVNEWKEAVKNTELPFAELIGKRTIWTMSKEALASVARPAELLELYDDFIKYDFNEFYGFSDDAVNPLHKSPTFPLRVVQDTQMCSGDYHAGYPIVMTITNKTIGRDVEEMRNTSTAIDFFRQAGFNYRTWCWAWKDGSLDSYALMALLPYMHSRCRLLKAFPSDVVANWELKVKNYMEKPNSGKNFDSDADLDGDRTRLIPYMQLAQQYGWKLYAYLGKCSRELNESTVKLLKVLSANDRREFFCKRVCEYANADLRPFFDAWGIQYGPYAAADMAKLPVYTGEEFWKVWNPDLIPDENERTPSSIKLPDDNYNKISATIDETTWSIDSHTVVNEGKIENIIDGKVDTKQNGATTGSYAMFGASNQKRPVYTPSMWVCFDMKKTYTIDKIRWRPRYFLSGSHVNVYEFRVEIKVNPEDEWISLGEYHIDDWQGKCTAALMKWYEMDVDADKITAGRYIRLTLLKGQKRSGKPDWNYSESLGGGFDEFTLGGTIMIGGGDAGEEGTEDADFPEWN